MSCNICCDDYNKSTRSKVSCPYCDFEVCRACCETYILSESIPKCMKPDCAKEWSRKFLRENFTNVFLTSKYREHLEDVLFDQEKALMPATQPIIEEKIRKRNIKKQMMEIESLIEDLRKQQRALERSLLYPGEADSATAAAKQEKQHFVRQCPANGCRGFLSSQWKCGICEQWSCPDCHELKGPNRDCVHTCDPNNVETAKLLAKDSKPCPKCQSLIFKISGCDQMWCTQCHTAFSWKTGKLEKNIHNPHFYEWQRKNGGGAAPRNPGDIECGRELTHYTSDNIYTAAKRHPSLHKKISEVYTNWRGQKETRDRWQFDKKISEICESVRQNIHNFRAELNNFQTDYVEKNQDLRIKYLENILDEEDFKILIQRNDKKNRKNTEVAQVIQLCNTAMTDIIYRLLDHLEKCHIDKVVIEPFMTELSELRNYCNNIFKDIAFTYNTVQYGFADDFRFVRVEKEKKPRKKKAEDDDDVSVASDDVGLKNIVSAASKL
jgi:hypothetical protein